MAPNAPVLSSAVIVPETEESTQLDKVSAKRRQSSVSTTDSKRPRLSQQEEPGRLLEAEQGPNSASKERGSKDSEERKRGKRLFGALLGTLNQSSSSTAQRRRSDIERKQREKLAVQAQEHDEQREKDREAFLSARHREKEIYIQQAARTRRENLSACARFLQTQAEPRLYYKPWKLFPEQKARIDAQIRHSKIAIDKEVDEGRDAEARTGHDQNDSNREHDATSQRHVDRPHPEVPNQPPEQMKPSIPEPPTSNAQRAERGSSDSQKKTDSESLLDGPEDGGEDLVKGDEDDVIY